LSWRSMTKASSFGSFMSNAKVTTIGGRRANVLRALVMHFSGMDAKSIVHCHLNRRGRSPAFNNNLFMVASHPEAGVLRIYCGANTKAWADHVIVPTKFRSVAAG